MASNCLTKRRPAIDKEIIRWTIEDLSDPCTRKSHEIVTPILKMKFHLCFEVKLTRTQLTLQCITADEWENDIRVQLNIAMYNPYRGQVASPRTFEHRRSEHGIPDEYCSFEYCQRYMTQGALKFVGSVQIYEEDFKVDELVDLSANFGSMLTSGTLSDMTLSAGGKDFCVHKIVLAARSPVFGAMFENKDSKEVQENRISIEDMSSDVCGEMLKHIYTGSIPTKMSEYAFDLYVAADKYQLTRLKLACQKALITLLDINSVSSVLLIADGCNAFKLKSSCIKFITKNSSEVMKSEGWKQIAAKNELLVELYGHLSKKSLPYFSSCNKKQKVK